MNAIQKRINELHNFRPGNIAPPDLKSFWQESLAKYKQKPLQANSTKRESPVDAIDVYDITYQGFDETPIHGWYMRPKSKENEPIPCIIQFPGYWGGPPNPEAFTVWTSMGYAVFISHVRGQMGLTGNYLATTSGMAKGFVTQNLLDRDQCYYKAIAIDSVRAVEWVKGQKDIDPDRIALVGGSQGGGMALITGALSEGIRTIVADIPNQCHMDFGMFHSSSSLTEVAEYCKKHPQHLDQVLNTLSYFDMLHLAEWITAPILMSVGLKDMICMPETIFPVYHRIQSEKSLEIYPFCGHEVVQEQVRKGLEFIKANM